MDNLERFRAKRVWEKLLDAEGRISESMDVGNELGLVSIVGGYFRNRP